MIEQIITGIIFSIGLIIGTSLMISFTKINGD